MINMLQNKMAQFNDQCDTTNNTVMTLCDNNHKMLYFEMEIEHGTPLLCNK